ncbi:MAG: type II toxin-antitoxin system YoeB family toxin [Bacteroidales bacterium]|nr:type II toxin-antitoxin system YoeB family toxin [Candidatus Physcocola equi]
MKYKIQLLSHVTKVLAIWRKSNPTLYKKTLAILDELASHPKIGLGHPEILKGMNGITYSRRISSNERIIYEVHDEVVTVIVLTLGGHYGDK